MRLLLNHINMNFKRNFIFRLQKFALLNFWIHFISAEIIWLNVHRQGEITEKFVLWNNFSWLIFAKFRARDNIV